MTNIYIEDIQLQSFVANKKRLEVGDTVRIAVNFSESVSVDTFNNERIPILALSTGGVARYILGSGSDTLLFEYTVTEEENSTRIDQTLKAVAFSENDAKILSTTDLSDSDPSPRRADVTIRRFAVGGLSSNDSILPPDNADVDIVSVQIGESEIADLVPPKLISTSAASGVYRKGDVLEISVGFNETVVVDASLNSGLPTLSLNAGGGLLPVVASYAGGSGSKTLRFQYQVNEGDPIANGLNVSSFNFNGGEVTDTSGNRADVAIVPGQNALPSSVSISIDGQNENNGTDSNNNSGETDTVAALIQSIAAVEGDGTYQAGDKLTFRIKLSEAVTVDASAGVPMLVLSNGGIAIYEGGSGSDELTFVYQVRASDRNADELRVLGVAENDATLLDAGGNATDVRVSQTNNLDVTNQVKISAQAPYIRTIDGIEGIYQPGDEIQLEVRFSEAVSVSDTPTLLLSNGARASYTSGTGTDTLMFSYTVGEGSAFSSADLDVSSLGLSTGGIVSVNSGNGVSTVVRPGILALSSDVVIDSTPPTGTVSIDAVALKKGESATVTLTFSEPVANPLSALEISNGTLDSLVTDETSEPGTVWKGTFRPDQDIESLTNTIVLDNSKVMDNPPADFGEGQSPSEWSFGNYGVGLSESEVFAIDTQSPVAQISSETLAGEGAVTNRLITVDFGEPVTGLTSSAITVSGSRKVPGTFTEVASGVYQLVVAPVEGAGTDTDKLSFGVSLLANAVTDAAGNSNVQLPATTFTWDEAAPEIASIASTSGSYVTGDVVAFAVTFDEVVSVSTPTDGAVPSLALSNGALAHYVSVSPDNPKTLRFEYVVASGDEATDLSVLALFENDGSIADASGNAAKVSIGSGNGLPGSTSILIDGVVPTITTMRSDDGLYLPGDEIAIEVQFSEAVHVDESEGSPVLALSNGALATYVGGSKTDVLHFKYVVVEGDYDAQDLDVLAFAEEGALVREYFGETDGQLELGDNANVAIRGEINSLAYRSEINIDSALPKIAQISANAGAYNAGDAIEIALSWSKGVSIDTTQGEPSLLLSNGALASYVPSLSSSTKLLFRYTVSENDAESGDLGIEAFRHGNARFEGLIAGGEAVLALPEQSLSAEGLLTIDLTPPEVVRFELSDTALSSGESATVTIELSEAVQQLSNSYVTVAHGVLSPFEVDESGVVWTATYTPYGDVSALDQVIRLDQGQLQDLSGNLGEGEAHSSVYQLDSAYPTVVITSDTVGVTKEPVRFVLNFSETVTGFDPLSDVVIEGGSLQAWSIETPDNSGRPEGEYSFIVTPSANSVSPIKVRVPEGVAFDEAGNGNARSQVFVQPIDTQKAHIESIEAPEGDYTLGETLRFTAHFNETVTLNLREGVSDHEMPELFLNNGQTARYVSGSGTESWVFEYTVATVYDAQGEVIEIDRSPIRVLSVIENDTYLLDAVGNRTEVVIGVEQGLVEAVSVDTTGPQVQGFSAIDTMTYLEDQVVWIKMTLDEVVTVTRGADGPTLSLSNGGTATYMAGSGSKTLMFRYQVEADDTVTGDLDVTRLVMGSGSIRDLAGNLMAAEISSFASNLSDTQDVAIDTKAPLLMTVSVVEDADTANDVIHDGYYKAGTTVAFDVAFDDAVMVDTTNGMPTLTLSNGERAQYVSGHGTETLRFEYTVEQDDLNRSFLEVVGLSENGGTIRDVSGNDALVEVFNNNLSYSTLVIDTKAPKLSSTADSYTVEAGESDVVTALETVSFSFMAQEAVEFDLSSIDYAALNAQTREDLGLAAEATDEQLAAAIAESVVAAEQALILSQFDVAFSGSRADAGDLSVSNFVPVLNADGHMMGFSVDVAMPDRALGEVTVSLAPGALRDLATNANAVTYSHSQAVDTQTVTLLTTPAAGLFIGAQSTVRVKDANGDLLASEVTLDPLTGQATVQVSPSLAYPGGYRGPVLIEVIDTDPAPDYIDEFTGEAVTLSDGTTAYVMRAMYNVEEPGEISVTVSPVTELAVTKLEEAMRASGTTTYDPQQVADYNAGVGKIFGLGDIVRTSATVVNSSLVQDTTGADVADFDATDGIDASEKYGQVLAMLSARDNQTGSVATTITELAADIKAINAGGQTTLAIRQAGADKLVAALTSSSDEPSLEQSGVNRGLLDVAYIEEAAASGFGLNLAEAESATIPIKGAQLGDTVVVQWGTIQNADLLASGESVGDANTFTVVITEANIDADGNVRVPVPLDVIQKQGDATEVAVRNAIIPAGATNEDGTPKTEVTEDDYQAPVLLTVDIIPPQTTVAAPDAAAPFVTRGDVEGIRSGDDLNILLNNSADEHFKYALSTDFLGEYETLYAAKLAEVLVDAVDPSNPTVAERSAAEAAAEAHALANLSSVPAGLQVTNVAQDAASGTWTFDWSLDLTQAISVAEAAAQAAAEAAGESYTPVATFTANDARSVFQVQASTADLVGNADADDARNEVIIGSVDDIVDSPEEQKVMDQALNRLSARYGDDAVDTRAEIQTIANAIDGIASITGSDAATVASEMTRASQTLVLGAGGSAGSPGAVAQGVHNLVIGEQTYTLDLSDSSSPTVADVISAIQGETGYAALPYTVSADASGNGVAVHWKAFGPQPAAVADVAVTTTETATQLSATITHPGGLASFAKQAIALDGTTDADGVFTPAVGDVDLAFDGVTVSASVAEGDTLADVLAVLQGESDYGSLPFALAINESGDGFTATWKQTQNTAVTEQITVDRAFEVTTTTETTATIVEAGAAGLTTAELTALDIQNVDDSELAAIARAIASDRASVSAPVVSFADVTIAAGETTTATLTFATRVGQVPDDALALIGGSFSSEGAEGDPIWTSTDGLTWTATFTATSAIPNTGLTYTEQTDDDGNVILDDNGDPILEAVVADDTTTPVTYDTPVSALSQVAITEALVNRVTDAAATVAAFADTQGASASPAPSVQDFADMAVENVRNDNVDAINDALSLVRDRFEGEGDLFTQIQTVTDSYNAVFNTVYASGDQPTAQNLVEDLNNLGVSNLSSDAARAEDQTTLLQGALQAVAAAKADVTNEDGSTTTAAEQQAGMIDSVAKLESFVTSVEKVLARANGEQAVDGSGTPIVDGNGDPVRVEVSDSDLTALGFDSLLADGDGNSRLSSLQKVIVDQSVGNGSAAIVDYANLKAVLETASDAFDDIVGLVVAAQDSADTTNTITDATFKEMGVDGVNDVAISGIADGAEMAAVIKDALVNTADSIDSLEAIQAIVDNYTQVLSVASGDVTGAEAVITNAQFANLGVTLSSDDAQEPSALAELLSGIIANKASPTEGGDWSVGTVQSDGSIRTNTLSGRPKFDLAYIDDDKDGTLDKDFAVWGSPFAQDIKIISETGSAVEFYVYCEIPGLPYYAWQYYKFERDAGGVIARTSATDGSAGTWGISKTLATLGIDEVDHGGGTQYPNAEGVEFNYDVASISSSDPVTVGNATDNVDSISELQALADAAKKVFDSAALDADPAAGNAGVLATQTDLNTLGFDTVDADNLDAIQRVLVRNAADRDAVKDYTDLKNLIDAAVDAHTALTDLVATAQGGSTPDLTGLDEADFAAMGLDDVDSSNVAAALDALSNTPNSIATAAQLQAVVDSTNVILDTASNDAGTIDKSDLTNIGITLSSGGLTDNDASLTSGVIASLSSDKVDTVSEVQAIVTAIDAVFANAARATDDDTTNTVTVTKAQLLTLGFDGSAEALEVTDHNLDAIQRVLTDQANEDAVASYAQLRTKINDAITAHADILNAATTDTAADIDEADYAAMGIDGVDAGNVQSINDALLNTTKTLTTAVSVQEMVDSYNHILDLRAGDANGGDSNIALDADDFTDLGVTLKAAGAEQTQQLAYLQEIVKDGVGNGSIATVADLQKLANATSDLIDMIQETSPDSDGVAGLTPEQFALLGIDDGNDPAGAITAAQADMLSKRLALTADNLSDVTNLATDLKGLWTAATESLAKIKAYAEGDGVSDFDSDQSFAPADADDVPTVQDYKNIGVVEYAVAEERTETLALSDQGYLTFGGQQPSIVYDVTGHTYNLIPVTQSVANDANQTPYFVIDTSGDGSVSSDDAMVSSAHSAIRELPSVGYYPAGYLDKVYPASDVVKVLQNNTALQIEGQSYATGRYSTDRSQQWVITWKNGGAVEEQIAADAATIYIADPSESAVQSISSTSISGAPALVAGNHYSFDVSDASLAGETFELLKASEDSGIALTVTGTPGQPNALIEFTVPASMTGSLTLTSTSVTVERSAPILGGMSVDITESNIDAINELFAATTVGADTIDSDLPATTAAEDQAVIDQGATRLQALLKIANYAQNNGVDTTTYPAPDAADFAAAGVTGVADDNNVATLLTRLRGTTSETNFAKADTAAELQAFVKKVAIDKIAKWADTDGDTVADGTGVNAVAPILQDYVNAGLVDPNDNAITAAMVPALNELFASNAVNTDAADTDALQQGIIDGAATQLAAMAKIASYAGANGAIDLDNDAGTGDANGYDQLTVADFDAIGVFGVGDGTGVSTGSGVDTSNTTFNNLTAVLNKLAEVGITYVNADTAAEVQALVGQVAVEKIAYYADEDGQLPLVTKTIAVTVDAKANGGGNAFYLDLDGDPATTEEAPALDLAPGTYTFTQSESSNNGHPLTFFLNNDRSGDVATQGITVTSTGVAGSNGVTTLVIPEGFDGTLYYECANHNGMGNSVDVAVPYFEPELQDYTNAGLKSYDGASDVVATDVASLNEFFAGVNIGGASDSYHADDAANQQAAIVANAAYLQAIEKIAQYAEDGNSSSLGVPTAADYDAAGIVGVYDSNNNGGVTGTPDNISVINQAILDDTASFTDANTAAEIQVIVSRGRITHYANTNGLDDQTTPAPLAAALVPTVADYANVGVTEIYDGSSLVAIDNNNLEQVNDLMAMRYVGNPDADGDGITAAQGDTDERIDVVNNVTDAATNETNLTYAGTVNTVAKIQDAVANAMGTAAADDRVAALNKIAAFAQAVSGLANQAAYDAYIANSANANGIPTYQDYNTAGVLGLTDSTEGINSALATAINAKLFTGGATSAVNTVTELQPFVDSANLIVDKIGAWAEPDWSGIGSADSYVVLTPSFENPDFQLASGTNIPGWVVVNQQIDLGNTKIAGLTTPVDVEKALNTYLADEAVGRWTATTSVKAIDTGSGNVAIELDTGSMSLNSYSIVHGPAIYSEGTVNLRSGDSVSVRYKAVSGGDAPDVFGYIQNVDTGKHITLVDFTGTTSADPNWYKASASVGASEEGDYRFVFIGGSFDYSGGAYLGAKFIIDDVLISQPPQKFNGVVSSNDEADYVNTQAVFDGEVYTDGTTLAFTSATPASASAGSQVELGWYDQGDFGFDPAVLGNLEISPKNAGTDYSKIPSDFDILGWDNNLGQWEFIKAFAPTVIASSGDGSGTASTVEVRTIALPTLTNNGLYTLTIGQERHVVELDSDATPAELATALNGKGFSGVTITEDAGNLKITWGANGSQSIGSTLSVHPATVTSEDAVSFDVSDATKAYTGFKIVARDTMADDGTVEITELDFKARTVTVSDIIAANSEAQPTVEDYNAIGFSQVTDANVADINAVVFAKSARSEVSTLPQIEAIIESYTSALTKIKTFTDTDGASDTNLNFTSDGTETGVPTVGDYQAIGLLYVKNGDGLNVPISNANIAAINEILAQAAYGNGSGEAPVNNPADLRTIFSTGENVNRLTAISKISEIAVVSPTSITLSDQATPTVSNGDVVILKLTTSFGSETISGTYATEGAWAELASALSEDLSANSGFVISQKASNGSGITVTRADGYEFKVEALPSATIGSVTEVASNFVLSDDASATSVTATEATAGDDDVQKIALLQSDLVKGSAYEFTLGNDVHTVYAPSSSTPALSDLVTALNAAINGSEPTVAADGTQGLTVTWSDNSGDVVPTLKISNTVGINSGQTITDATPRNGDGTTAEQHALDFAVANSTVYELNIGDDKYVVTTDATASLAELASALNTAITANEPTVTVNSSTGLHVTWGTTKSDITDLVSIRVSGNAQSMLLNIAGNANELTVADFTLAGVSGITSSNIEESVQTLVAKTTKSQIDTSLEITSSVNPPTQTITVDAISTDSGVTTDFITSDDDGLTVTATLSAALSAGQSLMYSNNNGTNFIDITSSVSGTAVSYDDSGLTSSDTIQMKIVDSIGQETTTVTQSVVIDTAAAAPTATTETINTNQSTSVTVAEAGTIYLVQHDATISSVNDITNLGDSHYNSVTATGAGSFDVSASGLTPDDYVAYFVDTAGNLSAFGANTVTVEAVPLELDVQLIGDTPVLSSKVIPVSFNGLDQTVLAEGDMLRVRYSANGSSGVLIFPLSGGSLSTAVDKFTDFTPTLVDSRYVELNGATINAADVIVVDGNHVSSATLESAYVSISNPPDTYNKQIEYSLDGGTTWTSSGISNSGYLSQNYPYQKITFASPFTGTTILKIRLKGEPSSEWSETIIVDTTDPLAPTYAESGTVVTVTGEADADVYLIRDDGGTSAGSIKYDVIDKIGTDDTAALQHLLAQDTHEWARGTIASGATPATGTIDASGLMDGTYNLYQVDRAGNFSPVAAGSITVGNSGDIASNNITDGTSSSYDFDVEFGSINDGSSTFTASGANGGSDDVALTFDLNDVAENDIVELYVDGQLAFSKEITASDKTTGIITTTNLNLDEKDVASAGTSSSSVNTTDNAVILELKVKHQGVYVQDGQDVTWDYQW